jgi:hypothetical protein
VSSAHDKYVALQRHRNATPLTLDPRTTALVIVDMQEYFLNPASPFSRACESVVPGVLGHFQERGRGVVEPSLRRLLDFFRTHGLRIVVLRTREHLRRRIHGQGVAMARMRSLERHEVDDTIREICEATERDSGSSASTRTLAHHPPLVRALAAFRKALAKESVLEPTLKELVRLKVANRTGCHY